jgi:hypothetical protein
VSYAARTSVPATQSRAEIEKLLQRYGADGFAYATQAGRTMIGFSVDGRSVRIELPMPEEGDPKREQEIRRRWRALVLVIKAKLEAVSSGISTIEREFLADVVIADGRTVHQALTPALEAGRGRAPLLLPEIAT